MRQAEIDGLDPVVVLLALADVGEAADPVIRLHAEFDLQRPHESAEHVQQHALAALFDDLQDFDVHQGGEHHRPAPLHLGRVIDLAHHLVGLVDSVDERQPDMARLELELRQDGVTEGFGGDAGAVRDEKYGAVVHGAPVG